MYAKNGYLTATEVLGRSLKTEEVCTFADIVHRISAIILLQKELDKNYHAEKNKHPKVASACY